MEKLLFTVPEAAKILGIGKNKMYDLIHSNNIKVLKLAGLKITKYELEEFAQKNINKDFSDMNNVKIVKESNYDKC